MKREGDTMIELEPLASVRPAVLGRKYIVASGHYLASMAGARILEMGGNVVDAGVATGLCINVLQPDMTNLGGVVTLAGGADPRRVAYAVGW